MRVLLEGIGSLEEGKEREALGGGLRGGAPEELVLEALCAWRDLEEIEGVASSSSSSSDRLIRGNST